MAGDSKYQPEGKSMKAKTRNHTNQENTDEGNTQTRPSDGTSMKRTTCEETATSAHKHRSS